MSQPTTFVSFSSADMRSYTLMCAWKAHDDLDFNFADFQMDEAINSQNPRDIKSVCEAKIRRADTFILLIGDDTWKKTEDVQAEVEVAIEKGCRLIGVNLNNSRAKDRLCPYFFANKGALFIPFSSRILVKALQWEPKTSDDWYFHDQVYVNLGYQLVGNTAVLPEPPIPFRLSKSTWAQ